MNKFYKLDENTRRTIFKQVAVQSGIPPVAVEKELVGAFSETLSQWDGCLAAKTDTVYYWNSFPH